MNRFDLKLYVATTLTLNRSYPFGVGANNPNHYFQGFTNQHSQWLAQLEEGRSAEREVVSSNPRRTINQGL